MVGIKKTGTFLGKVAGTVTGEPIKFIGKKLKNEYIQEIGEEVKKVNSNTGATIGSLAEGTWNTFSGFINKDEQKRNEGTDELKNTAFRTAKGMGQSLKNTFSNGKDIVQGAVKNDKEKIIRGAKGIGKTVAVSALSIGVLEAFDIVDFVDIDGIDDHVQADTIDTIDSHLEIFHDGHSHDTGEMHDSHIHHIETRNEDLEGEHHPVTGVEFESKVVKLPSGEEVEGVFPQFDSEYSATLPQTMYEASDDIQFSFANHSLADAINHNPELGHHFNHSQLQQIFHNETPSGYTWHHNEEPGKMQLVDEEIHAETGHTGGRELWGGGTKNR